GDLGRNRLTNADTMALNDLVLQHLNIAFRDPGVGQDTETSVHAIYGGLVTNDIGYKTRAGVYLFYRFRRQHALYRTFSQTYCGPNAEFIRPEPETALLIHDKLFCPKIGFFAT